MAKNTINTIPTSGADSTKIKSPKISLNLDVTETLLQALQDQRTQAVQELLNLKQQKQEMKARLLSIDGNLQALGQQGAQTIQNENDQINLLSSESVAIFAEKTEVLAPVLEDSSSARELELCEKFADIFERTICGMRKPSEARPEAKQIMKELKERLESHPNKKEGLLQALETVINKNCIGLIIPYCVVNKEEYLNENSEDEIIQYAHSSGFGTMGQIEDYM